MIGEGTLVAVVDDVAGQAETAAGIAEEAKLKPSIISEAAGTFLNTGELFDRVLATGCSAVICDHRLSQTGFASFTGAEFVATLYERSIPAVLLSTFSGTDSETSIRLHRARIPSLIARADLDPDHILRGLQLCEDELAGHIAPERQLRRTLVRIEGISEESDAAVADAIVHTWNPDHAIRFPLDLIEDSSIREALTANPTLPVRLFAEVNVGCRDDSELFFRGFKWAPEPSVDDLAT